MSLSGADGDGVDRKRWDAAHAVSATPTFSRIKRETICASLPEGIEPTTLWPSWPLQEVAAALDLAVGETLVDLACGRGEVGLWIAEHLGVAWVGVEPSAVGREMAAAAASVIARRPSSVPASGPIDARIVDGHFLATGLDDDSADGVLVLDALHFCPDLPATFSEVRRVLRPGRRLVLVGPQMADPRPALANAGFTVERDDQTEGWRALLGRFLQLAHEEAEALRTELGEATATQVLSRDLRHLTDVDHGLLAARAPM